MLQHHHNHQAMKKSCNQKYKTAEVLVWLRHYSRGTFSWPVGWRTQRQTGRRQWRRKRRCSQRLVVYWKNKALSVNDIRIQKKILGSGFTTLISVRERHRREVEINLIPVPVIDYKIIVPHSFCTEVPVDDVLQTSWDPQSLRIHPLLKLREQMRKLPLQVTYASSRFH